MEIHEEVGLEMLPSDMWLAEEKQTIVVVLVDDEVNRVLIEVAGDGVDVEVEVGDG